MTNCQFWNRGLSDVYLVETEDNRYVLRVSHAHWRKQSEINFELELLEFLRKNHLPVAYPLPSQDGKLSIEIKAPEGERYASLFTYAPGKIPLGDLSEIQGHNLGEVLATIHQKSLGFQTNYYRFPLSLDYLLDDSLKSIAPFLKHRNGDLRYLMDVISKIKYKLQEFPKIPPFWVVCWGDPHSGNAHFTKDNQVTLFDFDQCGYGWRIFDIAKFLQVSVRTGISKKVREEFLIGYQKVAKLTDYEISSLQAFTQTAHIWMWGININASRLHNWCRLDESYFTKRLEQLKSLRSHDWQLF